MLGFIQGGIIKEKKNPETEAELEKGHSDPLRGQEWQEFQGIFSAFVS